MINLRIDPNSCEERRRLSFALAISEVGPQTLADLYRAMKRAGRKLWAVVTAPPNDKIVGLSLLVLALLTDADVWSMRASTPSPPVVQTISSKASHVRAIRAAAVSPALNASMVAAASPF